MAGKKGENTKKVAGNARKAEAAAQKAAADDAKLAAAEEDKWQKGSKSNAKKWDSSVQENSLGAVLTTFPPAYREAEEAKKAEQARKKAEKDALLKEEEASIGGRAEPKKSKAPAKKSRGLDLSQLDGDSPSAALNASGIDNALDALSLTTGSDDSKIDKHPERRFAAAFAKYEERRLQEMKADGSGVGLRLNQQEQRIRKEFEKSPENPFNQVTAAYNATRDDLSEIKTQEQSKIEKRLDNGTVSARDEERLPPGGFSLRHGFPEWFGRGRRAGPGSRQANGEQARSPASEQASRAPSSVYSPESDNDNKPSYLRTGKRSVSIYHILKYIRSTFDNEEVLDSVPLEAAGNPGAWHAWRTHRRKLGKLHEDPPAAGSGQDKKVDGDQGADSGETLDTSVRRPGEWNWDGVWEDRVKKGIAVSLSEPVLYGGSGAPDELIRFLAMEENDVESVKENLRRTLGSAA
ncbi:Coiled-coil domain-containing protein [Tolypocladium ophioglossoides CBS 100239]|uniref:Coiled-coil domain-containing protein n=1 Tax=Tolypocladium ophioglossoides (strain CBS 100239) TaxID=1163406 RepID=A0A0L0NGC3_TOLOC|nr:Coiled-coil domain-containing protein [Tolypocladium ophioglossoides CBS 100239]